jgi:hypothetical protein
MENYKASIPIENYKASIPIESTINERFFSLTYTRENAHN